MVRKKQSHGEAMAVTASTGDLIACAKAAMLQSMIWRPLHHEQVHAAIFDAHPQQPGSDSRSMLEMPFVPVNSNCRSQLLEMLVVAGLMEWFLWRLRMLFFASLLELPPMLCVVVAARHVRGHP